MSENACPEDGDGLCEEAAAGSGGSAGGGRRGRPKAATITTLIQEGATSRSAIRCEICSRVFPRDKSLQAHRRVHTGERPYSCDFPGCMRKFKQSGQLKTHQRLHTGERPFLCSIQGCSNRFTHANRHCPNHPGSPLMRCDSSVFNASDRVSNLDHQPQEVQEWLIRYITERPKTEKKEKSDDKSLGDDSDATTYGCGEEGMNLDTVRGGVVSEDSDSGVTSEWTPTPIVTQSLLLPLTTDLLSDMTNLNDERTRPPQANNYHIQLGPSQGTGSFCGGSPGVSHTLHIRFSPLKSSPLRSSPLRSSPLRSSPLRSSPLRSSGALRILLRSPVKSPLGAPGPNRLKPVKNLFSDDRAVTSPRKRELPKKRWLRIASREQEPNPNQCRPTVLRLSGSHQHYQHMEESATPMRASMGTTEEVTPQSVGAAFGVVEPTPSPTPPSLPIHRAVMPQEHPVANFPTPPYSADKACFVLRETPVGILTSPPSASCLSDLEDELAMPLEHFTSPQQRHLLF